jgi:Tol biopolymer transport system component
MQVADRRHHHFEVDRVFLERRRVVRTRESARPSLAKAGASSPCLAQQPETIPVRTLLLTCSLLPTILLGQGAVQPCSLSPVGQLGNAPSHRPAISPDGRWIVFCSQATNLVAGDTNGCADVFVRDRLTGATQLVSVTSTGAQTNDDSWATGVSGDGLRVCFLSLATNLVPGDTNGVMDAFVRDLATGTTSRVSVGASGQQATTYIDVATISADGSAVVFGTESPMVGSDTNALHDVFVHTLATGSVERVSVGTAGSQGNGNSFSPCVSADGRFVAFHSLANNLVPGDTNGARDIFVRDRQNAITARLSTGPGGLQSNGDSRAAACSADARYVAFVSYASNLVPGDTNLALDVFVHDRVAGVTERVSVSSSGGEGVGPNPSSVTIPSISADGRHVAFYSPLNGLDGPVNLADDAFVRDRLAGRTMLVSRSSLGVSGAGGSGPLAQFGNDWLLETTAMANDPPLAVFTTLAPNMVPWDGNAAPDVFAVDVGLRCAVVGPALIGGVAAVDLTAPSQPSQLFVGTFGPAVTTGCFLPSMQWLPLDLDPLLTATLLPFVTDANGLGSWALAIPPLPGLVGLTLHSTALRLDFAGPSLFPAIGNVVTFVIQ